MSVALHRPEPPEVFTFSHETGKVTRTRALPELAVVRLTAPATTFDDAPVPAGTCGTIVSVYDDGAAYDVEVSDPNGIVAVLANGVELVE